VYRKIFTVLFLFGVFACVVLDVIYPFWLNRIPGGLTGLIIIVTIIGAALFMIIRPGE